MSALSPFRLAYALLLLLAATPASPTAASGLLAPHVARYRLSLETASGASDVVALKGRLEVRIEASCEGWRLEQSLGFRMLTEGGQGLEHLSHLSGFEERDGRSFTFSTHTWEDRRKVEEVSGVVRRDPGTGDVTVRYAAPEPLREELPREVLFPGQHVEQVLRAAHAGQRTLLRVVFDGSTRENPYEIAHAIGSGRRAGPNVPEAMKGRTVWPVHLAYFGLGAHEPSPEFQMRVMLYDNGVAGDQTYDYGDFAVDVRVEDVELLPLPECG